MSYYNVLQIDKSTTSADIRKAYRTLILKYHPDKKTGDREMFDKIQEAYDVLSDETRRKEYDMSVSTNMHDSALNTLIIVMMDIIKTQFETALKQKTQKPNDTSEINKKNINIKVEVPLEDVYNECISKIVAKVKQNNKMVSVPLYIKLIEHKKQYVYPGLGDDGGDLIVNIAVKDDEFIKQDHVLYEHDLYIEKGISLYEYIYGIDTYVDFFNQEKLHVVVTNRHKHNSKRWHTITHLMKGYGLPYIKDEEVCYGNLYIYFTLELPSLSSIPASCENFIKTYFNKDGVPDESCE